MSTLWRQIGISLPELFTSSYHSFNCHLFPAKDNHFKDNHFIYLPMWQHAKSTMANFSTIRNLFQCCYAPSASSTSPSRAPVQQDSQEASPSSLPLRRDNPSSALRFELENLPVELQVKIAKLLNRDSLTNLRETCTPLKAAASEAVTHVKVPQSENLEDAIKAFKAGGITALTVTDPSLTDNDLLLLKNLPELTELKELNLPFCWLLTDKGIAHLQSLTKLQKLDLTHCYQLTDKGIADLKSLTELQDLNLTGCEQLTNTMLVHLESLTKLQRLNLAGCGQLTDAGLTYLKSLIKLQYLNLSGCRGLTTDGLDSLYNQLTDCVVTTAGATNS